MDNPAAFTATYVTLRFMKTAPVVKIELEVPREAAQLVIDAIGMPPAPGNSVHVAVARLATDAPGV